MLTKHLELLGQCRSKLDRAISRDDVYSSMAIIENQSLLMAAGGLTFKALNTGEMSDILTSLTHLAYLAAEALVEIGAENTDNPPSSYQVYEMLPIMQMLSEKIYHCASGNKESYIDLYYCCKVLASSFLNADFDKAFDILHQWRLSGKDIAALTICDCRVFPNLNDCLYE